ncbi:TPA: hypothetical protein ACX3FG_002761 [Vibrio parahaemolyticus]
MQNHDERVIKHYRLSLEESIKVDGAERASFINLDVAMKALSDDVGKCVEFGGETKRACYTLKEVTEAKSGWEVLVNVVRTGVKAPVKNKIDGSNQQPVVLDAENGLEKSVHIFIQKTKSNFKLGNLTLLEQVEGMSIRTVEKVLNALLRNNDDLSKRTLPSPAAPDAKKRYKCKYKIKVEAVVSGDMFKEIARGNLINTTIITHDTDSISAYDTQTDPVVKKNILQMESINSTDSGAIKNFAEKIRKFARKVGGPYYKLEYSDASGATHTATLSSDTGNLLDGTLFVHKKKICDLQSANKDAYPSINKEIMQKMKECL